MCSGAPSDLCSAAEVADLAGFEASVDGKHMKAGFQRFPYRNPSNAMKLLRKRVALLRKQEKGKRITRKGGKKNHCNKKGLQAKECHWDLGDGMWMKWR